MNNLKSCVGCGNENVVAKIMVSEDKSIPDTWFVRCDNCESICTPTSATEHGAKSIWNNLRIWTTVDLLEKGMKQLQYSNQSNFNKLTEDQKLLKLKFEKLLDEYIKYRMLYSGMAGNLNLDDRRKLMTKEILAELGWD